MLRLFILLVAAAPVFTVTVTVTITGTAQREHRTVPCMSGVRLTEDMVELETTALAGQDFTVFSGNDRTGSVAARFKTSSRGAFTTALPPGNYCVVLGRHEPAPPPPPRDPLAVSPTDCDPSPAPVCHAYLVVNDRPLTGVRVTLHSSNQCPQPWANPCWRGPLPP